MSKVHIFHGVQESEEMTRNNEDPDSTGQPPDTNQQSANVEVRA